MPRSILLGRPWPGPGQPLFSRQDTAIAIALEELEAAEAADRCPLCGLPKKVCRDKANQWRFEAEVEQCHATYAMNVKSGMKRDEATERALQVSARLRE